MSQLYKTLRMVSELQQTNPINRRESPEAHQKRAEFINHALVMAVLLDRQREAVAKAEIGGHLAA